MKTRGFTLIEMVVTMIVGAILVMGIAGFVELGTKGYAQSVDRQRLQTQAQFVLEKMTREVRHALPNVFFSDGLCLSFYPIIESGFYAVSGSDIHFIVGDENATTGALSDKQLVINPTQQLLAGQTLSDLPNSFSLSGVKEISDPTISGATFTLEGKANQLIGGSVVNRQYISANDRQIAYCLGDDKITRKVGSGQAMPLIDTSEVKVSGAIEYQPAGVQHSGVVHIELHFSQNNETTRFEQDVQVLNVP
ncbi:MSHA biogenesis protein MshO [Vibrio panuliri]|uniref:MSHA biogenesis protein MshO n=1 Tax=Vibrio panuliri TaxID=1381081 RepID=A0A1Q9HC44_9VIBR|nr:prepilin-type N-terminal cleavage/methylation domain-containing protein [Vibrio panuliri]OLQ86968.1 MSHA biogenesis protein MshO [Vibrio panuliri]